MKSLVRVRRLRIEQHKTSWCLFGVVAKYAAYGWGKVGVVCKVSTDTGGQDVVGSNPASPTLHTRAG